MISRGQAIAIAVGSVAAAAIAAFGFARFAVAREARAAADRGTSGTGAPPPPPPPPVAKQRPDGTWYVTTVDGREVTVGQNGVTVDGVHFSPWEIGLSAGTGGLYMPAKYAITKPKEAVEWFGDKIGLW